MAMSVGHRDKRKIFRNPEGPVGRGFNIGRIAPGTYKGNRQLPMDDCSNRASYEHFAPKEQNMNSNGL